MNTLIFVTGNKGKVKEAEKKFEKFDIKVVQKDIGYPEPQVESLEEVANFGINFLKNKIDSPFIIEDAGIFIDSLKGFPGVYSKYVFYTIGCNGILKLLENKENRHAVFKSLYAYYRPGKKTKLFLGKCEGKISDKIIGSKGFGYDPIFIPKDHSKTFGEMEATEKNMFSHRGKSLEKLIDFIKNDK